MDSIIKDDYDQNYNDGYSKIKSFIKRMLYREYRWIYFFRKCKSAKLLRPIYIMLYKHLSKKLLIDIGIETQIGAGFSFGHGRVITINYDTVIGNNVKIFQGVIIGSIISGKKKGTPIIGNNVVVGANASVFGRIRIGNNVFIAANSYVNFDVPDNSIVIGNPGMIKKIKEYSPVFDYIKKEKL